MSECEQEGCDRRVGDVSPKTVADRAAQLAGFCSGEHRDEGVTLPVAVEQLQGSERMQAGWE